MLLESLADVMEPLPDLGLPAAVSLGLGHRLLARETTAHLEILTIGVTGDVARVSLQVPLGDALGYWHPNVSAHRTLLPDWHGAEHTSMVTSSPFGALYDSRGQSILAFAFDAQIAAASLQFGVAEERKAFVVHFEQALPEGTDRISVALVRDPAEFTSAVGLVRDWATAQAGGTAAPVAPAGLEPVYSTWYAFLQDVNDHAVEREAQIARELGCRVVFLDDGWQRLGDGRWYDGCGDWVPDDRKFPDLAAFVERLHSMDMSVVLWVAPLLLGESSDAFEEMAPHATHWSERLRAHIVDPRRAPAREWVVRTCLRLLDEYVLDGLKIDFLDEAMAYATDDHEADEPGYIPDVGAAMHALLGDLRKRLDSKGRGDALIEFRQPYVGPAVAPFGNLVRANDCPADGIVNRRSIIDTRLATASAAVHSDPMMWGTDAREDSVSRQLLNGLFGVPQVSMRLSELPPVHLQTVRSFLALWREHRDTILHGRLRPGLPAEDYPVIDTLGVASRVVGVFQPRVVELGGIDRPTLLLNGTSTDSLIVKLDDRTHVDAVVRGAAGNPVDAGRQSPGERWRELMVPAGGSALLTPVG